MNVILSQTIDHRWILRRADDGKIPADAPSYFNAKVHALAFARLSEWNVTETSSCA